MTQFYTFAPDTASVAPYVNANFERVPPIGSIIGWTKTFLSLDSGTTDGTTANKLVQSGQNFQTTVAVGNLVHNTTDDTFAYVTAVDSDTTLSLDSDIMVSGETFVIYATPALESCWVECNGQTLSDAESIYDGATIPSLNDGANRFLRGAISSGTTGGSDTIDISHVHQWYSNTGGSSSGFANGGAGANDAAWDSDGTTKHNIVRGTNHYTDKIGSATQSILPSYYQVVWIMRVK